MNIIKLKQYLDELMWVSFPSKNIRDTSAPQSKNAKICILDNTQNKTLVLEKLLKWLADDQFSSIS